MGGIFQRLKLWWETADRTQRTVTLGGGIFLIALLFGTFTLASRPSMVVLFPALPMEQAGKVQAEIEAMGIPVQLDNAGTVRVPQSEVPRVKAALAQSGNLPKSNHAGYEGLSTMGIANTPRVEQERLRTMLEGELAQSIEFFDGVQNARVHIVLPERRGFAVEDRQAKATVTVMEKSGASIGPDQGRAMALLVASAVPELDSANVSVFDRAGRPLFDPGAADGMSGQANTKFELERQLGEEHRKSLQATLDRVFGAGNTVAMVNVGVQTDLISQTEKTTTPSETPITRQEVKETMSRGSGGSGGLGGPAGAEGNMPGALLPSVPPGGGDGGENFISSKTVEQRGTSETNVSTRKGVGEVIRMGVSVAVNSEKIGDPTAVTQLVTNYVRPFGSDPARFSADVTSYAFDTTANSEMAKADAAAASSARIQQILSVLPIGALLIVGILVMRALGKVAKGRTVVVAMPDGHTMSIPAELVGPNGLSASVGSHAPALSNLPESITSAMAPHVGGQAQPPEEIGEIGQRLNIPLEQIKKMAADRPEVVAMLIKSWLIEDRR